MASNGIKIVFGGAKFLDGNVEDIKQWLDVLEEVNVKTIDTAQLYGKSEEGMGNAGAATRFTIDTKFPGGFMEEKATKENIVNAGQESLKRLQTDQVDIYYIHAPERQTPIKDTLAGLNDLYKQGKFKRLGLSNYSAEEVEEYFQVAKENNFVTPSVYQGNYSAISRRTETEIFPTLRKHNMSFYAYSPIAGGFLSKSKSSLQEQGGRFDPNHPFGALYNGLYNKPSFISALDTWEQIAEHEKASRSELAYRWIFYHSQLKGDLGDGVIVGARNPEQLRETVKAIKAGPLSAEAAKKVEDIWQSVKADSILDNFEFQTLQK